MGRQNLTFSQEWKPRQVQEENAQQAPTRKSTLGLRFCFAAVLLFSLLLFARNKDSFFGISPQDISDYLTTDYLHLIDKSHEL